MSQPEAERARAFLDRADADLTAVRALEKLDTVPDEIVGFHGQQAAEKLLKAVLAARGIDFPRTHSIRFLLDQPTTNVRARKAWIAKRLRPIGLHEARHTYASLMIAAGVNAKALSTYLGHSSVTITYDRYGDLMPGNTDEAAALLDSYLVRATQAH